ncbi:hypothetical protein PLESTB_001202300 [Pleodorina starrii]|uniref:FHA domain-containing protein n=1 Tax=Pleodorina starrii TaxID=330485 RepID=A0A9W6BSN8_9CHLO|nr:hypothetical protein PLESTM_001745100 [Pleodorina starrii]GLC57235.1 hypothetical protein PLESTB_001202300 [Pleodorina starrii]GLC71374.1 hypothetical protein PLESTF_001108600 [Pleodorina starrii]
MRISSAQSAKHGACLERLRASARPRRLHSLHVAAAFTLTDRHGKSTTYSKAQNIIGSSPSCDIKIDGAQVAAEHAAIIQKGKQTFLKPLVGESMLDDSLSWKDGVALRPGVSYLLATGCSLAFGTSERSFTIQFEEGSGSNPLVEMMMKGMLANSSGEVKKALGG